MADPSHQSDPAHATPEGGEWWAEVPALRGGTQPALLSWQAVRDTLRDRRLSPRSFTDDMVAAGLSEETARQLTPLFRRHGEDHRHHRALLSAAFTPRRVERLRPVAADLAGRLADRLVPGESVEFVTAFARPLPPEVFAVLFGLPAADAPLLADWAEIVARAFSPLVAADDIALVEQAATELRAYCAELIADRRRRPSDDLVSHLLEVEIDGERLDDRDVVATVSGFIFAGAETTRRQLTALIIELAEHPEVWADVATNRDLVAGAVEEALRHRPIVPGLSRVAIETFRYRGLTVEPEGRLLVSFDAANHDAEHFPDPDTFRHRRENADEHVTFGWGPHYCVGAGLARVEMQESLRTLTARFGPPLLDPGRSRASSGLVAPDRLPVTFAVPEETR